MTPNPIIPQEVAKPIVVTENYAGRIIAVPKDYRLETDSELALNLPNPTRKKGSTATIDAESFIEYVNLHKQDETIIYAKIDDSNITCPLELVAVFNEHRSGRYQDTPAGWRDFRATFKPKMSHEWKTWLSLHREEQTQFEFAEFIEENGKDIVSSDGYPTGIQMLTMATNLEVTADMRYKSSVRLQSGSTAFEYVDQEDNETIKKMEVFQHFLLGFAPFWKGQAYQIESKLRYRRRDGKVFFTYGLIRHDLILNDAINDLVKDIKEKTGLTVIFTY